PTDSREPRSNPAACASRMRVDAACGPSPYSAWKALVKYQTDTLPRSASSASRTGRSRSPARYSQARCMRATTWRLRRCERPVQRGEGLGDVRDRHVAAFGQFGQPRRTIEVAGQAQPGALHAREDLAPAALRTSGAAVDQLAQAGLLRRQQPQHRLQAQALDLV